MPVQFSSLLSGTESLEMEATATLTFEVEPTGGSKSATLGAAANMASSASLETFRYRQFEADASVVFIPEVYDSNGRLKWAIDGDRTEKE